MVLSTKGMTPAERVLATFERKRLDRIAIYHSGFSSRIGSALLGRECYSGGGINRWRESKAFWEGPDAHAEFVERTNQDAYDLNRISHTDLIRPGYWRLDEKPTKKIDDLTFLYGDPDGDYVVRRLNPVAELYQDIDKRASNAPQTFDDLEGQVCAMEEALESYHPTVADFQDVLDDMARYGPEYELPSRGYGLAVSSRVLLWLEAVAARPDLVERQLECQCIRNIRMIRAQSDLPTHILFGGGDFCGKNGPNYSPRFFHKAMLPRLQRMSAVAKECGKYTTFASDGDLWPVADDLFGASGVDGFNEIDRLAGMDHWKLKAAYPNLVCFGNVSTITLHRGTKDEVIAQCRDNAEAALELGGILCGVSNQVPPLVPVENVIAMIETFEEYH